MKNKILVIDDEFLIRYTLAEGLKDRGYETESAGSVEEGLEKMKTFGPEVILLSLIHIYQYCFGADGVMLEGWNEVDGNWYYFYPGAGNKAVNTYIDGFYVDANGVWRK